MNCREALVFRIFDYLCELWKLWELWQLWELWELWELVYEESKIMKCLVIVIKIDFYLEFDDS
jgi:hypothetical protein